MLDTYYFTKADFPNMSTPLARAQRKLQHSKLARRLTFSVLIIIAALLCYGGSPLRHRFCTASLPQARFAVPVLDLKHAQRVICSKTTSLPESNVWNLSYHQGGNGPWIPKVKGVVRDDLALPTGCVVDQVHIVSSPSCIRILFCF